MTSDPMTGELHVLEDTREPPREEHPWNNWSPSVRVTRRTLPTGDFVLEEFPNLVVIERKTVGDLLSVVTANRERFERELARMQEFEHRYLIVEGAGWFNLEHGRYASRVHPNSVSGSLAAWEQRFGLRILPCADAPTACAMAEKRLRRARADHLEKQQADYGDRLLGRKDQLVDRVLEDAQRNLPPAGAP